MKVLLLHGYRQDGPTIIKKCKKLIPTEYRKDIVSPTGPYEISSDEGMYGWWELTSPSVFTKEHSYINVEDAISTVKESIMESKLEDIKVVIGFSQGAVLADIMMRRGELKPSKAILISPSGIMDARWRAVDSGIDTLLVYGTKEEAVFGTCPEQYISTNGSTKAEIYIHDSGHVVPNKSVDKEKVKEFLSRPLLRKPSEDLSEDTRTPEFSDLYTNSQIKSNYG